MAKLFSKCLGKIVLMAAAVLWAGCDDSERNDGSAKQDSLKLKRSAKVFVAKAVADPETMDSVISAGLLYGSYNIVIILILSVLIVFINECLMVK